MIRTYPPGIRRWWIASLVAISAVLLACGQPRVAGPGGGACAVTLNRENCLNVVMTGENVPALNFCGEMIVELVSHATRQVVFELIQRFARGDRLG